MARTGKPESNDEDFDESRDGSFSDEETEMTTQEAQRIREIGAHPMLQGVQEKLLIQLKTEQDRLDVELRDKIEGLKRMKKAREDTGVALYSTQQQLAKLQLQLESTIKEHATLAQFRLEAEKQTLVDQKTLKGLQKDTEVEDRKLQKQQKELDKLNVTIHQCEKYNESMKGEISVVRRAAYKTEENVGIAEKKKQSQDVYIDGLNERIKTTREQYALYKAQLVSQKQETTAATKTLLEAFKEMEAIEFEKKQLMAQWRSSLIGVQRRDEALSATHAAVGKQLEQAKSTHSETKGIAVNIKQEQTKNENHTAAHDKIINEISFLKKEVVKLRVTRKKLEERYGMLKKSLEQTDKEGSRVELEKKNLLDQIKNVTQSIKLVNDERQEIEDGIALNRSTQTTVSKAAQNLAKDEVKIRQLVHKKEKEMTKMENEMSRAKVDTLNTIAHNKQLRSDLDKLSKNLKEKDKLIEKYDLEIRQRNDQVEKKMYIVDRLNRKLETLAKAGVVDESSGPLEATILSLEKDISASRVEQGKIQRRWLRDQTELVNVTANAEQLNTEIHRKTSEKIIVEQRELRVDRAIKLAKDEVNSLRKEINNMHGGMTRLNTLIASNTDLQAKLASTTFSMETSFVAELRELESASVARDSKVRELVKARKQLLEDVAETERQLLLWKKQYALEKETQDALDPTVGVGEGASMRKEIHRMKLRYTTLKREQEKMIEEMELAIEKRESIATRNRGRHHTGYTKQTLTRRLHQLEAMLQTTAKDTKRCKNMLVDKESEISNVSSELEKACKEQDNADAAVSEVQQRINDVLYEKQRITDGITMLQRMHRRYKNLADGNEPTPRENGEPDGGLIEAEAQKAAVLRCVKQLQFEYPQFSEVLSRVGALTDVSLPV